MIHRFYTQEQLSHYFMSANIMNVICLMANMMFHLFIPTYATIGIIIDNFDNFSLFVTCLIVVSQALLIFTEKHQRLTEYKLIIITVEFAIATFFVWVLTFNSVMQDTAVTFYSIASIAPHHKHRVVFLLILIAIMLCFDLYYSRKEEMNKVDPDAIKEGVTNHIRLFITKYFVFIITLTGIFHIEEFQKLSAIGIEDLKDMLIVYSDIFIHVIIIIWIAAISYYVHKIYEQRKK